MARIEHNPLDLLIGGLLIAVNVGMTVAGAYSFGGGPIGLAVYIVVPASIAWVVGRLMRQRWRRSDPGP